MFSHFRKIPSNSVFNHRFRKLCSDNVIKTFFELLLKDNSDLLKDDVRIIDSQPIVFKNINRRNSKNDKMFGMSCGYCASLKEKYFGLKLHFLVTKHGFPCRFMFTGANVHDNSVVMQITYNLENITLIGDKGYISESDKIKLDSLRNIKKITPYKKNMKNVNTSKENELLKYRKQIERNFSSLSNMSLKRCRAKSSIGVIARVSAGILAQALVYIVNVRYYDKQSIAYCEHFR